ncbi:MAG: hypothetical protein HC857_00515 [Synechococcales cyanobacterium RU_4_20]|nr:hypothetical protein [Synechococcales cyanobacterium RU_4_20]
MPTTPIQNFGNLRSILSGTELVPIALPDGSGGATDHRCTTAAIAALVSAGNVVAIVAPNPRGTYDPGATYTQLDSVRYSNAGVLGTYLHWAETASTGVLPTDTQRWMLLAEDGGGTSSGGGGGLTPIRVSYLEVALDLVATDDPVQWVIPNISNLVRLPATGLSAASFFYLINGGSGNVTLSNSGEASSQTIPEGDGAYCWFIPSEDQWRVQIIPASVGAIAQGGGGPSN